MLAAAAEHLLGPDNRVKHLALNLFRHGATALNISGLDGLIGRNHKGIGAVFVLHSIVRDRQDYLFDSLRTSSAFLESLIRHFITNRIDIVTIGEVARRLEEESARPFVCFTFDDGFKDNLTTALPIFARHNVPFTVFVTTCFIERMMDNWWTGLAEILKKQDLVDIPELGMRYQTGTFAEKVAAYQDLSDAIRHGSLTREGLDRLLLRSGVTIAEVLDRDALDLAELRTLAAHPLAEIGGHTTNHPRLSQLSAEEVRCEMIENKHWLEVNINRDVHHFAYPFGDRSSCGPREAQIASDIGFKTALSTRIGNLFTEHRAHLRALPRLRLFNKYEDVRLIEFQRRGGAGALFRMFRDPIVTM